MTQYVFAPPDSQPGIPGLQTGDTVLVNQGATVTGSTNGFENFSAFAAVGSGNSITVDGTVVTSALSAIALKAGSTVQVNATGRVQGRYATISMGAAGADTSVVINAGTITNGYFDDWGMAIRFGGGIATVVNSGEIVSGDTGIYGGGALGTSLTVQNTGQIKATMIAIAGTYSNDVVINTGYIHGSQYGVVLYAGDDLYDGRGGLTDGQIKMGEGNDTAYGGEGNEDFSGGEGNDLFFRGIGASSFIDGGSDSDTVGFVGGTDLTVDLSIDYAYQQTGLGLDKFIGVENIWSANGNDSLTGSDDSNAIAGNGGDDTIIGGKGDDLLVGGEGSNLLEGGAGADTLDGSSGASIAYYRNALANSSGDGITINFNYADGSHNTGEAEGDHYISITGAWGSLFGDTLIGDENANWIVGDQGNDTITTGGGDDSLHGSEGNDELYGGAGDDLLVGGAGDNLLDGGLGADTLDGTNGASIASYRTADLGVTVDLNYTDGSRSTGAAAHDHYINISDVWGSTFDDTLIGNDQANWIIGDKGDDTIRGGEGNDTLDGGAGENMAVLSGDEGDYVITENSNGTTTVTDKRPDHDGTDQLKNIRLIQFNNKSVALNNAAPDTISLTKHAVAENASVDTVVSALSAHDADGDAVVFTLVSDAGGLFELQGVNLVLVKPLDYETQTSHVITIEATDEYDAVRAQQFTISVTNVADTPFELTPAPLPPGATPGSPAEPLILRGTPKVDVLSGSPGDEFVYGLGSNDRLRGEAGNDRLYGGVGNDTLWGGSGHDVFVFDSRPNKKSNVDKVVDFNVKDDAMWLDNAVFKKLGKGNQWTPGKLEKAFFTVGAKAKDKNDFVVYNKTTGALYYDKDGVGDAAQIQIATLQKSLKGISYKDFFVV